jgi:hypothetical protein
MVNSDTLARAELTHSLLARTTEFEMQGALNRSSTILSTVVAKTNAC